MGHREAVKRSMQVNKQDQTTSPGGCKRLGSGRTSSTVFASEVI
jgi:hypothetical protein